MSARPCLLRIASACVAIALLALSTIAPPPAFAAEPPTPRARQAVDDWLQAFNANSLPALQSFVTIYGKTSGSGAKEYLELRGSTGPLKVLETRTDTVGKAEVVVLAEDSERALMITAVMDPAHPAHVSVFQLEGVPTSAQFQPRRMALPALMADVRNKLDALQVADALSGSVLVAQHGTLLLDWQGGLADRESGERVSADTRFRLASSNKMFTAVAILQLAQAGKLTLQDTIGRLLPAYPNRAVADTVTVQQLLSHTAGLGDFFGHDFATYSASLKTLDDYVQRFADDAPEFTPGTQDGYSNYGYIVLGAIIEAVSGQSYYDYVDQHIFAVAGMTASGFQPETALVPHRAPAYTKVDGEWRRETATLPWRGMSAGGGYSTAADMLKFAQALQAGTLVSTPWLQQATRAQNHKGWYGYGFMVQGEGAQRQYGHEGGAPGSNSAIVVLPEQGYVLIGLANVDPDAVGNIINYIARRLPL